MSCGLWPALLILSRDARLILYDHRGHGRSLGEIPRRAPLEALADDAATLVGDLGLRRVAVLGHSNGGFIALHLALRHPRLVRRLVLVSTAASGAFRPVSRRNAAARGTPAMLGALERLWEDRLEDDAAFARAWRTVWPLYFRRATPARLALGLAGVTFRLEARRRILPAYDRYDVRRRLGGIRAPTLVIAGRYDWITPPEFGAEVARGIPGARLVVFERSGHSPFIEEPTRFREVVGPFLSAGAGRARRAGRRRGS